MMHDNPSFRYDLMSGAYVRTGTTCHRKDLVRMGSVGLWLEKIPEETELIILSFGLDDTLGHLDVELQKNQTKLLDRKVLVDVNKPVVGSVAEKCVDVIEIVLRSFPRANILYILPPPSESEPVVVDLFRKELKVAWQKGNTTKENTRASIFDGEKCLESLQSSEVVGKGPGHLSWTAGVTLSKEIDCHVFPDSKKSFSTCCSTIHIKGTCNKDHFGQTDIEFGKNACRICNSKDHRTCACPAKDYFREQRINCGHCGCLSSNLTHHPDVCRDRFSRCKFCAMYDHSENVHRTTAALRIASTRLGSHGLPHNNIDPMFDKKVASDTTGVADIVDVQEEEGPGSKKLKLADVAQQ